MTTATVMRVSEDVIRIRPAVFGAERQELLRQEFSGRQSVDQTIIDKAILDRTIRLDLFSPDLDGLGGFAQAAGWVLPVDLCSFNSGRMNGFTIHRRRRW